MASKHDSENRWRPAGQLSLSVLFLRGDLARVVIIKPWQRFNWNRHFGFGRALAADLARHVQLGRAASGQVERDAVANRTHDAGAPDDRPLRAAARQRSVLARRHAQRVTGHRGRVVWRGPSRRHGGGRHDVVSQVVRHFDAVRVPVLT